MIRKDTATSNASDNDDAKTDVLPKPTKVSFLEDDFNSNSQVLTHVYRCIKTDLKRFHAIMAQLGSAHGKNLSKMIETALLQSGKENPLPIDIQEGKLKRAIALEKNVTYSTKTKKTLNEILDRILETFNKFVSEAARYEHRFEIAVLTFCTTISQMHRTLRVEDFQNSKHSVINTFLSYFDELAISEEVQVMFSELQRPSAN